MADAPTYYPFKRTLKYGDKGRDVEVMQDWLGMASEYLNLGFDNLEVNGKFGVMSRYAVNKFQNTFMTATGVYDYETYHMLNETVKGYIADLKSNADAKNVWNH
jgi:hypothetical protein